MADHDEQPLHCPPAIRPDGALPAIDPARYCRARDPHPDTAAMLAWLAHVDAGRIGGPAPVAVPHPDRGLAGLAAILGIQPRREVIW